MVEGPFGAKRREVCHSIVAARTKATRGRARWLEGAPPPNPRASSHPMYPSGADGGLGGWSGGLLTALRTHTQLLWCLASSSIWPQRVVWGAIGRARGGPKPQLGLWGHPLATGMPPWVVVRPNEQKQARVSSVFQLGAMWVF